MSGKTNDVISSMWFKGYRANEDGSISSPYSHDKPIYGSIQRDSGYLYITSPRPSRMKIKVHRFVAYCKYGGVIFKPGIVVRHLNNNKLDNSIDNIVIGTNKDNSNDIPKDQRVKNAARAARKWSLFLPVILELDRLKVPRKYIIDNIGIPKATLSNILNNKTYSVVGVDIYKSTGKRKIQY